MEKLENILDGMVTVKQLCTKWGLTKDMVFKYLYAGRIEGAVKLGNAWYIPKDAEKPADRRLKNVK